jgi:carboxypeptidase Taq
MTAAQLFDAAKRADPGILPAIARGDFAPLLAWLRANVHSKGSRFSTAEIITQATGRPLDARTYERHLETRYLAA